MLHDLNNKLQTRYNPIADQYPKVGNPKILGMTAFHINISIKGNTRTIIPTPIRLRDDFFIGLQAVVVGQGFHDRQEQYHLRHF